MFQRNLQIIQVNKEGYDQTSFKNLSPVYTVQKDVHMLSRLENKYTSVFELVLVFDYVGEEILVS